MMTILAEVEAREIQGVVTDHETNPVHGASVVVMSLPDSIFLTALVTDESGMIKFDTGAADSVLITVQTLASEPLKKVVDRNFTIRLHPKATQLQEVVVEDRPAFRSEAGRFVFTPGDLVKRVGSAEDILLYIPMVKVGPNDIQIAGSSKTIIYVNGKQPRGLMKDIKALIKSLPPSCIRYIEVITDPGASVDGSYNGAILNIVLTYPWEGFRGIASTRLNWSDNLLCPQGRINLYYTQGKWALAYSGMFETFGDEDKTKNYFEYKAVGPDGVSSFINNTHYRKWVNSYVNYFIVDYNFTDKTTLGAGITLGGREVRQKNLTTTAYDTEAGEYVKRSAIRDTVPFGQPWIGANLYYTIKTDSRGSNLDVVVGYHTYLSHTGTGMRYFEDTLFQRQSNYRCGWSGRAEYQHRFPRKVRLKVGVGFTYSRVDDALDFYENSNRFIYRENLASMFGELSFPWHRTSFVLGLRVESEFNKGEPVDMDASFKRHFTAVLPGISFNWNMPWGRQTLSVSANGRVVRPFLSYLKPFRIWTTENSYKEGNPYLKNYYYWSASMNYVPMKNLIIKVSGYKEQGRFSTLTIPDEYGIMATAPHDVPGGYYVYGGVYYTRELFPFWSINTAVDYSFNHTKFRCEGILFKEIYSAGTFEISNVFNFSKQCGISGNLNYRLRSPSKRLNDTRATWTNHLSVSVKKEWKNCTLTLHANGLIPCHIHNYTFDSDVYFARYEKMNYMPYFQLSFRYVFGNPKTRGVKARSAGADSRFGSF